VKTFLISLLSLFSLVALADGPVVQTTPLSRTLLRSATTAQAQTALGFTGNDTSSTTMLSVSNWAQGALAPQLGTITNNLQLAYGGTNPFAGSMNYGVYDIRQWGARLDGQVANNCSISAGGITLTAGQNQWTAGDVGKVIMIYFAGTNGVQNFTTGISNYISATQIGLSNAVISTVSTVPAIYGHDDSCAYFAAVNWIALFGGGKLYQPINPLTGYSIAIINTNFSDVGDWRSHWNAQIYPPAITMTPYAPTLTLQGALPQVDGTTSQGGGIYPRGSIIVSTITWGGNGTNIMSCFNFCAETGGNTGSGQEHLYGVNGLNLRLEDIRIIGAYNNNCALLNASGVPRFTMVRSKLDGGFGQTAGEPFPIYTNTIGLMCPEQNNDPGEPIENSTISYFYRLVYEGENCDFQDCNFYCCSNVFWFENAGGNLMGTYGVNNIQGFTYLLDGAYQDMMIDLEGLNLQETGATGTTNWFLDNPSDNNGLYFGFLHAGLSANSFGSTNQAENNLPNVDVQLYNANGTANSFHPIVPNPIYVGRVVGTGGLPQANTHKFWSLRSFNFSEGAPGRTALITYDTGSSANGSSLDLGGPGGGDPDDDLYGVHFVEFYTSASDLGAPSLRGYIDGSGNLNWQGGNASGFGNLSSGTFTSVSANGIYYQVNASASPFYTFLNGVDSGWDVGVEDLNNGNWPNIGTTGAGSYFIQGNFGHLFVSTNGSALAMSGIASIATNTVPFSSTGITNTLPVNVEVFLSGSGLVLTNFLTGFNVRISAGPITIQPQDAIWGSSVVATNRGW
jgi:hypothetical protein